MIISIAGWTGLAIVGMWAGWMTHQMRVLKSRIALYEWALARRRLIEDDDGK